MALGVLVGWATMLITMLVLVSDNQKSLSALAFMVEQQQTKTMTTTATADYVGSSSQSPLVSKIALPITTFESSSSSSSSSSSNKKPMININEKEEEGLTPVLLDLKGEALGDRSLPEASLDLHYALHLNEIKTMEDPTYDKVMMAFHTHNIWTAERDDDNGNTTTTTTTSTNQKKKSRLDTMLDLWNLRDGSNQKNGSPILDFENRINRFLTQEENPPRVIVEVGVYRGGNSIQLAKRLEQQKHLKDTFIICIDTWLLDLRYAWTPTQTDNTPYFQSTRVAGHEFMYFVFLANILKATMQHRIIPLPSSSLNGALALIANGIRPDLVYLDASHANPDVFLDLVNFWTILQPGGILVADDYKVALSVHAAVEAFRTRFQEEIAECVCRMNQCWVYKKMV